jgi:hypothetical protein
MIIFFIFIITNYKKKLKKFVVPKKTKRVQERLGQTRGTAAALASKITSVKVRIIESTSAQMQLRRVKNLSPFESPFPDEIRPNQNSCSQRQNAQVLPV